MAHIILDKSYLDAVSPKQIKCLFKEHTVLMPDVLIYELTTTNEKSRKRCFNKFHNTTNPVELIPNIGTLLRYELMKHRPCTPLYDHREKIVFNFHNGLRDGSFNFTKEQLEARQNQEKLVEQDTRDFFDLAMMVNGFFPDLNCMRDKDLPQIIQEAKSQVATNIDMVRQIYESLLAHDAPPNAVNANVLGPTWAYFRWVQVRVIYSLDLILSYRGHIPSDITSKFWRRIEHHMLDAEYVILASLAGSFACNEKKLINYFKLICPEGFVFTYES